MHLHFFSLNKFTFKALSWREILYFIRHAISCSLMFFKATNKSQPRKFAGTGHCKLYDLSCHEFPQTYKPMEQPLAFYKSLATYFFHHIYYTVIYLIFGELICIGWANALILHDFGFDWYIMFSICSSFWTNEIIFEIHKRSLVVLLTLYWQNSLFRRFSGHNLR